MSAKYAELEKKLTTWLSPISPAAPAGVDPGSDPRFIAVKQELAKLNNPSAGSADWRMVLDSGGDLLATGSKDLLIASAVSYALLINHTEEGLAIGLSLISGILENFWDKFFPPPARMKGRVNAIVWLNDRVSSRLKSTTQIDGSTYEKVEPAWKKFSAIVTDKFGNDAPSLRDLRDEVERLRVLVAASAPPPPPPPVAAARPATPAPAAAAASAPPPPPPPPAAAQVATPADPAGPQEAQRFLREVGQGLVRTAVMLRKANAADPAAYRLLRVGVWLHLSDPPAPGPNGRTGAAGLSPANRASLEQLASNGGWPALLENAEALVPNHCFSLDLQRFVVTALKSIGPSHRAAHDAAIAEVATLVKRMPKLRELVDREGAPLADDETRAWLDAEVTAGASPSGRVPAPSITAPIASIKSADGADDDDVLAQLNGRPAAEAIALIQTRCATAPNAATRFRMRLVLAEVALRADKLELARAIHETLETECKTRGLDEWAPELASVYLRSHLQCLRALAKRKKDPTLDGTELYRRLCRIDPAVALELGA